MHYYHGLQVMEWPHHCCFLSKKQFPPMLAEAGLEAAVRQCFRPTMDYQVFGVKMG